MEEQKKLHRCCFTGHRPEKLNMPEREVKERLRKAIREAVNDGFITFITGMARGVDLWAGEIVLEERKNDNRIKLICASPFKDFEKSWDIVEKNRYNKIMEQADYVKFVCDHYSRSCFQIRNCALFTVPPGFNKIYIFLKPSYLVIKLFIVKELCALPKRRHEQFHSQEHPWPSQVTPTFQEPLGSTNWVE